MADGIQFDKIEVLGTMNGTEMDGEEFAIHSADDEPRIKAYSALLAKAEAALRDMRDRDRLRPPTFNVFFALGHAYREVSTHSAMLAYLLDPAAGHAQDMLFLRKFLDIVRRAAERQGKQLPVPYPENSSRWQCRKEVRLPRDLGQVDVLLRGPELMLVLENKILAGDQENQLRRYWDYLLTEAEGRPSRIVVYLTPDGRTPTAQSLGGNTDLAEALVRLSYRENIYELVRSAADMTKAISVAEILRQYAALVERLG